MLAQARKAYSQQDAAPKGCKMFLKWSELIRAGGVTG